MRRVVVVGGGPAGMLAAISAANEGAETLLLEKNEKLGKKLYITGKGRCNVTNAADGEEFLRHIPRGGRFFRSSFSAFDNQALQALLEPLVPLKVERGQRVFPQSDKASDITKALSMLLVRAGVRVFINTAVTDIETKDGLVTAVQSTSGRFPLDALVLATGGVSYPATGSTGDGYRFAQALGHPLVPPIPSLIPFETKEDWPKRLQGLTLKNIRITAKTGKKLLFTEMGELLFTHFGISGPLALEMSAYLPDSLEDVSVALNLKPALTPEQMQNRILRDFDAMQRKELLSILEGLVPKRMVPEIAEICGIDPHAPVNQINRAQRMQIAALMQELTIRLLQRRPVEEAIITRGGVDTKAVRPSTLASKLVPNLFFAGELLDIDACTGGFNLQIAFSTGRAAGTAAAQLVKSADISENA